MSTVYITQLPVKRRPGNPTVYEPAYDLTPTHEHGNPIVLLPSRLTLPPMEILWGQLDLALHCYDFHSQDCLLTIGDPVISAVAVSLLASRGSFYLLRRHKVEQRYERFTIQPTH